MAGLVTSPSPGYRVYGSPVGPSTVRRLSVVLRGSPPRFDGRRTWFAIGDHAVAGRDLLRRRHHTSFRSPLGRLGGTRKPLAARQRRADGRFPGGVDPCPADRLATPGALRARLGDARLNWDPAGAVMASSFLTA